MTTNELKQIILTNDLNQFIHGADVQQIGIGCSGDSVLKISKDGNDFFLKYSANKNIETEYKKLNWLQGCLPVPQIISYQHENGIHYLLTRGLAGEMICTPRYMKNWHSGLNVILQAFEKLWATNIQDCSFDARLDYKLKQIKVKIDSEQIKPEDIRPEFLEKYGSIDGIYEYLIKNKPDEQLCFSHGDTSLPNIFGHSDKLSGFIDVSDCGVGDIWFDIAVTAKSIKRNYNEEAVQIFYREIKNKIGKIKHDIIDYYLTLVEL